MRGILAFLLVAIASPASGKVWVGRDCVYMLTSKDGVFMLETTDGRSSLTCRLQTWPLDEPIARLNCEGGKEVTMAVWDNVILFAGIELLPKGDSRIICD